MSAISASISQGFAQATAKWFGSLPIVQIGADSYAATSADANTAIEMTGTTLTLDETGFIFTDRLVIVALNNSGLTISGDLDLTLVPGQSVTLTFGPVAPVSAFSGTPLSGSIPLTTQFSNLSTGNPTNFLWDFGDGSTSAEQNPSHIYTDDGLYTVSLRVSNAAGTDTLTKDDYVDALWVLNPSRQYTYAAPAIMSAERKSTTLLTGVTAFNRTTHTEQDYNVATGATSGSPTTVSYSDIGAGHVTNAARNSAAHGLAGNADLLTYLGGAFTTVSPAGLANIPLSVAPVWVNDVNYAAFVNGSSRLNLIAVADGSGSPSATRDVGVDTDSLFILADQNGEIYFILNHATLHHINATTLADIQTWDVSGHGNIGSSLLVEEHGGVVYAMYQDTNPDLRFLICDSDGTVTSRPNDGIATAGLFGGGGNFQRAYYGLASIGHNQVLDGLGVISLV